MIPRDLTSIEAADLKLLLEEEVPEGLTLEFKRQLDRKQRLLATVCAFANTGTGDLIIGAEEKNHYLTALPGVAQDEVEGIKQWIEDVVRSGLEPPSVTVWPREVALGNGRWVIVVRVERSWAGPHRVTEPSRFYRRHSTGNCEMTMEELRRAFTEGEMLANHVRRFRDERIERIRTASAIPVRLNPGPKAILHLVPLASAAGGFQVDVHEAKKRLIEVGAFKKEIDTSDYNLDGVVGKPGINEEARLGYVQIFRNGAIERVAVLPTKEPEDGATDYSGVVWPPETRMMPNLADYLELLTHLGVPWPVYALISVVRVKNYKLMKPAEIGDYYSAGEPMVHDTVPLPEVELPRDPAAAVRAMRPVFDIFWQAFQLSRSAYFDEAGNYTKPRASRE